MPHWIATPDALRARITTLPPVVGLDTEFIRERTYWPQLALVQVALGDADDAILLVDTLVPGMPEALGPLLSDPAVLKVMHSASEDLVAFRHACGALPAPLFDTQIAAGLAGTGTGMGYQKLVHAVTGVLLAKGETRSDWLRRPLTPTQLDYAADDVRHLHALHARLSGTLHAQDRSAWLEEECARLLAGAANDGEPWPHLALRSAQFLDRAAQLRLLRLLRWRDAQARRSDRPRSWILDNELAVALARANPGDAVALQALLDAQPKAPRSLREALLDALHAPLADEHAAPDARSEERDKARLRQLQVATAAVAAETGIAEGLLASRRLLQGLLDGAGWTGALSGWRRGLLHDRLQPLLDAPAPAA